MVEELPATATGGDAPPASSSLLPSPSTARMDEGDKEASFSVPEFQLSSPLVISSFLSAFLYRYSELFLLDQEDFSVGTGPHGKRPKHLVEALWLKGVLEKCLKEIKDSRSFSFLVQVVSEHEDAAKRVPESIEHVKSLNSEMHSLRQQIQAEDLAHKEAVITWNKTFVQMRQGIKDLKAQNKLTAKFRLRRESTLCVQIFSRSRICN